MALRTKSQAADIFFEKKCKRLNYETIPAHFFNVQMEQVLEHVSSFIVSIKCRGYLVDSDQHTLIRKYCPHLKHLDISTKCTVDSDVSIGLETLILSAHAATFHCIEKYINKNNETLMELCISNNTIDLDSLLLANNTVSNLKALELSEVFRIDYNMGTPEKFQKCYANLQTIRLNNYVVVNYQILLYLAELPKLQELMVKQCPNIDVSILLEFIKIANSLKKIIIVDCDNINQDEVGIREQIKAISPNLEVVIKLVNFLCFFFNLKEIIYFYLFFNRPIICLVHHLRVVMVIILFSVIVVYQIMRTLQ